MTKTGWGGVTCAGQRGEGTERSPGSGRGRGKRKKDLPGGKPLGRRVSATDRAVKTFLKLENGKPHLSNIKEPRGETEGGGVDSLKVVVTKKEWGTKRSYLYRRGKTQGGGRPGGTVGRKSSPTKVNFSVKMGRSIHFWTEFDGIQIVTVRGIEEGKR